MTKPASVQARLAARVANAKFGGPPRPIRPGDVYVVDDAKVVLPENRARIPHRARRVVVIQCAAANDHGEHPTVLVVPTSASQPPGPFDMEMERPNGFTEDPTLFVSLVQPMLKDELGARQGQLTPEELAALRGLLVDTLIGGVLKL